MQIQIGNVLAADEVETVRTALAGARFIDGRETAGFAARGVKNNRQAAGGDRSLETIRKLVAKRILDNEVFRLAVRPKALSPLLFSRYEKKMHYGSHVDDALMGGMRTDVSFTLFLSDPVTYDGGELVIESASGEDTVKLAAGSLVAYPSTALHRVTAVTRGVRLAAAGWARSFVRDAARRELLFDLDSARRQMFAREGKTAEFDLVSKSLANLMRMWAED
ncbi:MAG: PKHD-type hydroxylase [Alphaproteobacteria bacterium]|jgi:PKHD-type hydroxylase|nr:PKHD-type hydroxylase [Alphaproteobacteria bacterium]